MWPSMRATYYPIFPIIWLAFSVVTYLTTPHSRASSFLFMLMIGVGVIALLYLSLRAFLPRVMSVFSDKPYCRNCYSKLTEEGFCPKCGGIDTDMCESADVCPKCGERIKDRSREFCPRCGNMLKR